MKLHKIPENISLCCNLKVETFLLGISSCTSMHGCPYFEGYKVDDRTGKKTNKKGRYRIGRLRKENNIIENKILWDRETECNRKILKNYMNCENIPLKLRENQGNVEVLFLTPPDPLHVIYLGPFNHVWTCLRKLTDMR